jgi:hypothetical protein
VAAKRWMSGAAVGLSVLLSAACSSGTSTTSAPTTSSSTSSSASRSAPATPSSSAATTTALSLRYEPPTSCLMAVSEVSSVLGGVWSSSDGGAGQCTYSSDRGAMFVITPVESPPAEHEADLADARVHSCDTPPRDVPDTGGAYVCIERSPEGDLVEGNIIAQQHFWLIAMLGQGADPAYAAQSDAMAALLTVVRR